MDWFSIDIDIKNDDIKEIITAFAFEIGASGVEDLSETFFYDDEKKNIGLRMFFDKSFDKDNIIIELKNYIKTIAPDLEDINYITEDIEKQNWREKWKENYTPQIVGKFTVLPEWMRDNEIEEDKIKILISPKMAFGTGTHETTQLMLDFLSRMDIQGKTILDAGCGSGILSIGAIKLGAKKVFSIDIDQESMDNSLENAILNNVENSMNISMASDEIYNQKFDTIIANINRAVLIELFDNFYKASNSEILLSGILIDEKELIYNKIKEYSDLKVIEYNEEHEWCAILIKKI